MAGSGLTGGGDLTTNRTIGLQHGLLDGYATSSVVTSLTNDLQAQINFVEDTIDGYALGVRNISAGFGLIGGGNLTADRTISIQPGLLDGYTTDSELNIALSGYVPTSRLISVGSGLVGGGDLTSNRTIALQGGLLDGYIKGNSLDGYAALSYVNSQDSNLQIQLNTIIGILDGYVNDSELSSELSNYATSSSVTSLTNNLQAQINFVEDTLDGYARNTITISAGSGLTGGGNLTANRVIGLQPGLLDGYLTSSDLSNYALTSTVISLTDNLQSQINLVEDTIDGYISGVTVRRNSGSNIGSQPRINFIEGSGVNLTITNDPGDNEVDITISASGGSGSGTVIGPVYSDNNAIALFDGYDGYVIKNSFARISSAGVLTLDVQEETAAIILSSNARGELIEGLNSELLDGQDGSFYTNASNLNSGILNTARFNDTSHGSRSGGNLHADATISASGFMSGVDKAKLNAINLDGYIGGIAVRENSGSNIGVQPRLNFIEGSNISLTIANDPGDGEIDITISASGEAGSGDVVGPSSSADNSIVRFDGYTGKLIDDSSASISDDGNLKFKTAGYNEWPTLIPVGGNVTASFDGYQACTIELNASTVNITLNTPHSPGAFKIILEQDGTGGNDVEWIAENSEPIYGINGSVDIGSGANDITLIGLIWDGNRWFIMGSSPMELI